MRDYVYCVVFVIGIVNLLILISILTKQIKIGFIINNMLLILLVLPIALFWGYYLSQSAFLDTEAIMAIMQTNISETQGYLKDYFSFKYTLFILMVLSLFFLSAKYMKTLQIENNRQNRILILLIILISLCCVYKCRKNILTKMFWETKIYIERYQAFYEEKELRKRNIATLLSKEQKGYDGIYFLVIGESQNKNHMHVYGYDRETTPWLSSVKNDKHFVLFKNAYSCHTHTVPVLTYALTAKNQYNTIELNKAVSLLEIVEAAGYETVWLSNQVKYSLWDTPITVIATEANQQQWINKNVGETTHTDFYDIKLVEQLNNVAYSDKMLIVIHLMGNHGPYRERYPKEFDVYSGRPDVDDYDNSILYNDYVMQEIYNKAKEIPNFKAMLYFADHSEAVKQKLGHNAGRYVPDMTEIPMYIIFSDSYMQEHSDKVANFKSAANKAITNDLIFNTVLSLMHVEVDGVYEAENDIGSKYYNGKIERFRTLDGKKKIGEE